MAQRHLQHTATTWQYTPNKKRQAEPDRPLAIPLEPGHGHIARTRTEQHTTAHSKQTHARVTHYRVGGHTGFGCMTGAKPFQPAATTCLGFCASRLTHRQVRFWRAVAAANNPQPWTILQSLIHSDPNPEVGLCRIAPGCQLLGTHTLLPGTTLSSDTT
jgi:hypothetical protein